MEESPSYYLTTNKHHDMHFTIKHNSLCDLSTSTWLNLGTEGIHILAAGLSKQNIVAEVLDLHFHEVEDLLFAVSIRDVLLDICETAQNPASTYFTLIDGALVAAVLVNHVLASLRKAVVQSANPRLS